jgi:hypothetical protein
MKESNMSAAKALTLLASLTVGMAGFGCESNSNTTTDRDMNRTSDTQRTDTMTDTNKMRGQGAPMNQPSEPARSNPADVNSSGVGSGESSATPSK